VKREKSPPPPLCSSAPLHAALAFAIPFLAYLLTLPPGLTWAYQGADGGDLITAACTLGIPHPPGYPTYTLLGWLFCQLPAGSIAWRFNLLSAAATAGAAGLLFAVAFRLTRSRTASLVAAWSFAAAPLVWSQAIITEVYALNLFFVALLLWLACRAGEGRRYVAALGLASGLAMGTHLTTLFLLPTLGAIVNCQLSIINYQLSISNLQPLTPNSRLRLLPTFLSLGFSFLVGLLVFGYLPLRAGRGAVTWGEPETWRGFWALVTGQIYRPNLFAIPPEAIAPRLLALAGYLSGMGVVGLALAGLGLRWFWRRRRGILAGGTLSAAAYALYALGYKTADSFVYLLPLFALLGVCAGAGLADLLASLPAPRWRRGIAGGVLALLLTMGAAQGARLSLRGDRTAESFWQGVLSQAPPRAILLTTRDRHTFALWYAHFVLRERPDVAIIDVRLAGYPWGRADIRRADPALTDVESLPEIFARRGDYPRPLCAVLEAETERVWQLDCLTSSDD